MDCGDNEIVRDGSITKAMLQPWCCNRKHIVTCREAQSCMHAMSLTIFAVATDQEAGYAFEVLRHEEKLYTRSIKLGLENSIIHLKLLGIEEVVRWSQNSNDNSITIHSNIYSSLQTMENLFLNYPVRTAYKHTNHILIQVQQQSLKTFYFHLVGGHSGVTGEWDCLRTSERRIYLIHISGCRW